MARTKVTQEELAVVKATADEVTAGTDDAKFATAKAIKDSKNVPSVAPGTSGNVLTSDGTDWVSAEPSGGGIESIVAGDNITVDDSDPANPVVAASGGLDWGTSINGASGNGVTATIDNSSSNNTSGIKSVISNTQSQRTFAGHFDAGTANNQVGALIDNGNTSVGSSAVGLFVRNLNNNVKAIGARIHVGYNTASGAAPYCSEGTGIMMALP